MSKRVVCVELKKLNAAIFISDIGSAVSGLHSQAQTSRNKKKCILGDAAKLVPDDTYVVLGCRDGDVGDARAVAKFKGVDGSRVVRKWL